MVKQKEQMWAKSLSRNVHNVHKRANQWKFFIWEAHAQRKMNGVNERSKKWATTDWIFKNSLKTCKKLWKIVKNQLFPFLSHTPLWVTVATSKILGEIIAINCLIYDDYKRKMSITE